MNHVLKMKCYDVVWVVRTDHIHFSRKGLKKMKKNIWRSGALFITVLVMQQMFQELFFLLPFTARKTKTSSELQDMYGFNVHDTESINLSATEAFIQEQQPDIIVSSYFPYILKPKILAIPRIGTLNVHPGLIPQYKWVMAYFWALKHNMKKAGVCVHWMDEWIDTWPIIAMKEFAISPKMTQDNLMIKTALIWSTLLKYVWTSLQLGKTLPVIAVDQWKVGYYSVPKHKDFTAYRWMRNFFSIRVLRKAILGRTQ